MGKNKITRWIDIQNEKLCLKISKTYYRKIEAGLSIYYIFSPRFYPFLLIRLLILLLNLFRFSKKADRAHREYFQPQPTLKSKILDLFLNFSGVKHFIKSVYLANHYHEKLKDDEIFFSKVEEPTVSIIIPVFNQIKFTMTCLKSLHINISSKYRYEVILVDDCSTDESSEILGAIKGLNYIRNEKNLGFLSSCIKGIEQSRGRLICLLNNDTIVLEDWLEQLVTTLEETPNAGCIGSKLIYPYGLLQEAGGIIYEDATGVNYGKFQNQGHSKYNYKRVVDYCSGASILFKKEDYYLIGGLDKRYEPAYYEDTDLCFSFRHILGKDVIYQPASVVVHFEGISSGKKAKSGNTKSYQDVNRTKFLEKWNTELKKLYPKTNVEVAARKHLSSKKIMVIDSYLPIFDRESGSNRLFHLLNIFRNLGYHIVFIPADGKIIEPYYGILSARMGIEVVTKQIGFFSFINELKTLIKDIEILWICRPRLNRKFKFLIRYNKKTKWIYDTVDLHYVRFLREFSLFPSKKLNQKAKKMKKLELSLAKQADFTIAITPIEAEILRKENINNVEIIPNIHLSYNDEITKFENRGDLCFIGSYDHSPNVDAAFWLINEIMPSVWETNPEIRIFLLGNNPTAEMLSHQNKRIIIPGFIEDVSEYFLKCKIFVAPLRYGAGMKGKMGQSLAYALPIITTDIGAEGMALTHYENVLLASDTITFVKYIIELYKDEELWEKLSKNSIEQIRQYGPAKIEKDLQRIFQKSIY